MARRTALLATVALNASRTACARALDIIRRVRRGDEASLKLRRREIDAALQTSVKKSRERFQIASLRAGEIDNRRGAKNKQNIEPSR